MASLIQTRLLLLLFFSLSVLGLWVIVLQGAYFGCTLEIRMHCGYKVVNECRELSRLTQINPEFGQHYKMADTQYNECVRMLNVNNSDYVLGYSPKWRKMVTQGEELLNKLLFLFSLHKKVFS